MKRIVTPTKKEMLIRIEKIRPFINVCKVTSEKELCNITVEYVPDKYVLELESYRQYFNKTFNMYIEEIAESVFNKINSLIKPKKLIVRVYLEDEKLTPWSVEIKK